MPAHCDFQLKSFSRMVVFPSVPHYTSAVFTSAMNTLKHARYSSHSVASVTSYFDLNRRFYAMKPRIIFAVCRPVARF